MNCQRLVLGNKYVVKDKLLGKGAFAYVYKGYRLIDRLPIAFKRIDLENVRRERVGLISYLEREILLMMSFNHPNVLTLYDCYSIDYTNKVTLITKNNINIITESNDTPQSQIDKDISKVPVNSQRYLYLCLEYCNYGDLDKLLKNEYYRYFNEFNSAYLIKQLAEGIKYLISMNVVHRDLKPQNVLLLSTSEQSGKLPDVKDIKIKIADFGFAKRMGNTDLGSTMVGTPLYLPYELLIHGRYSFTSDLWSIGLIIYQMLMGRLPFKANSIVELVRIVERWDVKDDLILNSKVTDLAKDLVTKLLIKDPEKRISWNDFFSHKWLTIGNSIFGLDTHFVDEFISEESFTELIEYNENTNVPVPPKRRVYSEKPKDCIDSLVYDFEKECVIVKDQEFNGLVHTDYPIEINLEPYYECLDRLSIISDIADLQVCKNNFFVAVGLYLIIIRKLFNCYERFTEVMDIIVDKPKVMRAIKHIEKVETLTFDKVEFILSLYPDFMSLSGQSAEDFLYNYSLELMKNSLIEFEIYDEVKKSNDMLKISRALLTELMDSTGIIDKDKDIVQSLIDICKKRII